jgi:hypothetical protein
MNDKERQLAPPTDIDIQAVIASAVQSGNLEVVNRLMEVRTQLRDEWTRGQYYAAMNALQAEMPVIQKDTEVLNKDKRSVRYRYAKLDSIIRQVGPLITKHGFSWQTRSIPQDGVLVSECIVTHHAGHSETARFTTIIDERAYMTDSQKGGSASTFGNRYAFCAIFGIVTGDQDDDAQSFDRGCDNLLTMMEVVRDSWPSIAAIKEGIETGNLHIAVEAWAELTNDEKKDLWVAPTKGGIFTTAERAAMHSDEWHAINQETESDSDEQAQA